MVAGLKAIPHDLVYLSNDDVETPTAMIGKKVVPILELGRPGSDEHEVRCPSKFLFAAVVVVHSRVATLELAVSWFSL